MERSSVCYVNPARLLRRPISEIIAQQEGKRRLGLLIPAKGAEHEKQLHHADLFKEARILTYKTWQPPWAFEWPVPGAGFLAAAAAALRDHDVIHMWAHFYPSNLLLLLLNLRYRKRVILTMDTLPGYSCSMGRALDLLFKVYTWTVGRLMYGLPDAITLYGNALVPHARRSGIPERKITVLPTGMTAHTLPGRGAARSKVRKELRLADAPIILYAGLLNPRKRVGDLLHAAGKLPEAQFLIAGDGPSTRELKRRARGLENVRFLGWRRDLLTLMRAADAFAFPSAVEGLPGAVMEAMYCGTPVVTTRIPCTTDLITHGTHGLLYPTGRADRLARHLRTLLEDPKRAKTLAGAAQRRITERYSWTRILPAYERLYEVP